jgi:hypothetical protein
MRITKELLLNTAHNVAAERTFRNDAIVCIYLTGSLTGDDPLLGGVTDIDLVIVHASDPPSTREVVPLAEEFHLDIWHYPQSAFIRPKKLRLKPWIGSSICCNPVLLYDTQHFFEFTQASVFAHFGLPTNIATRARLFSSKARQKWLALKKELDSFSNKLILSYLEILYDAGNTIACLTGFPLVERRFIQELTIRAQLLERPGLAGGLVDLYFLPDLPENPWSDWLEDWRTALLSLGKKPTCPTALLLTRINYYEKAIQSLSVDNAPAALWILLWTWALSINALPSQSPESKLWHQFCTSLNLGQDQFNERFAALDFYLESVEEALDQWATQNGV